jgi:hypothetical protein
LHEASTTIEVELVVKDSTPGLLRELSQFGRNVAQLNGAIHLETESETRIPELNRWLVAQGVDVYRIGATKPSLERVFLQVMGEDARAG